MNIFVLDENPKLAAQYHNDKHVVKMILETAQLLSTAHRVLDGQEMIVKRNNRSKKIYTLPDKRENFLYGATHINHPCAIWCRENIHNYHWLVQLFAFLLSEYGYRYDKDHKCGKIFDALFECGAPKNINPNPRTPFALAMPDIYKVPGDAVASYRNYYRGAKLETASGARMDKWRKRGAPAWWSGVEAA